MNKNAKKIVLIAVFTSLLIGGQFVLSSISGVEIVTVLFLSFCFLMGVIPSLLLAWSFSLLRCFLFGFFPTVIILYLTYFSLFAILFGTLGNVFNHQINNKIHFLLIVLAMTMSALFTALDNVITPLFFQFSKEQTKAYCIMSLTSMIPQIICSLVTVAFLLRPLLKIFKFSIKEK